MIHWHSHLFAVQPLFGENEGLYHTRSKCRRWMRLINDSSQWLLELCLMTLFAILNFSHIYRFVFVYFFFVYIVPFSRFTMFLITLSQRLWIGSPGTIWRYINTLLLLLLLLLLLSKGWECRNDTPLFNTKSKTGLTLVSLPSISLLDRYQCVLLNCVPLYDNWSEPGCQLLMTVMQWIARNIVKCI